MFAILVIFIAWVITGCIILGGLNSGITKQDGLSLTREESIVFGVFHLCATGFLSNCILWDNNSVLNTILHIIMGGATCYYFYLIYFTADQKTHTNNQQY